MYVIYCRLPWDTWSSVTWPICSKTEQIAKIENEYNGLSLVVEAELIQMTGCSMPCKYSEYKLVGSPKMLISETFGFQLSFAKTEAVVEREALVYEFVSFVCECGGALGLFLGFSFFSVWDIFEAFITAWLKLA